MIPLMLTIAGVWAAPSISMGGAAANLAAQPTDPVPETQVIRRSPRILQLKVRGLGMSSTNIVVVATQKGLLVIDTWHAPFIFEQVRGIVQQQFGRQDFSHVVLSHADVDHASGAGFFADVTLVGRKSLLASLEERHADRAKWEAFYRGRIQAWVKGGEEKLARLDPASREAQELATDVRVTKKLEESFGTGFPLMPEKIKEVVAFDEDLRLDLGDVTLECRANHSGHTSSDSDILIYVPEEGFLFTGDVPLVFISKDVNMPRWLALLDHYLAPTTKLRLILGGHNEQPVTREELCLIRDYHASLWDLVQKGCAEKLSLDQVKARCSLDGEMSRFRSLAGSPFRGGTPEELREKHAKNIETLVGTCQRDAASR